MFKILTVTFVFSQFIVLNTWASSTKDVVRSQLWYGGVSTKKAGSSAKIKAKKNAPKVPSHLLKYIQKI